MQLRALYRYSRLRAPLRVAFFLACVNVFATWLLLSAGQARAEEAAKRGGLALLAELGPELIGPPEVASINGQRMSLASKSTPESVEAVLGRFRGYCRERSGGLTKELERLPGYVTASKQLPEAIRDPASWLRSEERQEDGKVGQLACIARAEGGGLSSLWDSVLSFVDSGDVGQLGDMRYVIARRDEKSGLTHVLAMWTEGSFNVLKMFPARGDAPGSDPARVPRPPASRRVFSARIEGYEHSIRMYDSDATPEAVRDYYARLMRASGWNRNELAMPQGNELDLNEHVQAFSKDSAAFLVVVHETLEEKTGVTLIEMGGSGFATTALREAAR